MNMPIAVRSTSAGQGEVATDQDWNKPFVELFIIICFLLCFLTSLLSSPLFNTQILHIGSVGFFTLWLAFRWGVSSQLLIHLACLLGTCLCLYLIATTGGTVSVVMVVFVGLAWLPFLLLPLKAAAAWIIGQFNALLFIFVGSELGWINTKTQLMVESAYWTMSIKLQALAAMMLILDFLYRSRQNQINALKSHGEELEKLHLELIRAQSHKDEFIASVGHELRTPMNAILGLNSVLREEIHNDTQDLKRVDLIRKSTQHLLSVVNDILDFSQLQAERMVLNLKPFHLCVRALNIFEKFKIRADVKELKAHFIFAPDLPDWIMADDKRFNQMLDSLLENALKFTHQGSITLRFLEGANGLRIEVQDTGIGMTEEQTKQAFSRFEKSSPSSLKLYGGTGLGLSICEKLVHLHGGQLGVQSQFNHGSLFWIELPLTPSQPGIDPTTENASISTKNTPQHFLIVDDHPVNLIVAKRMVEKTWPKSKVGTATTGKEALAYLHDHDVDMILMDMLMPDMDGMEATRLIRQLPSEKSNLPILGLTASSNAQDLVNCLESGMNAMILKPLDIHELEKNVSTFFHRPNP